MSSDEILLEVEEKAVIVCASGYWDPLTIGHIEYLKRAKQLGDMLVVIVNSDNQAKQKKGFSFMCETERLAIVRSLKCVDAAILSVDTDRTVRKTLEILNPDIFAKGGDTTIGVGNIPEKEVCDRLGIKLVDGLGDKIQSSRWILREAKKKLDVLDGSYLNSEM